MATVTYNSVKKFRYYGEDNEEESGVCQSETLRDKLLKNIIANQLKTNFRLEDCIKNKEKFVVATKQEEFTNSSKGLLSNELFKKFCKEVDIKEILLSCDLDEHDINILLEENCKLRKGTEESLQKQLKNIERKIELRQNRLEDVSLEQFSGVIKLNRHEYEEECNKICSLEAEKLTSCLVQLEPYNDPTLPAEHPINKLSELEKQLFPHNENIHCAKKKTKKRKLNTNDEPSSSVLYLNKKPDSFWDMKERPLIISDDKTKVRGVQNETCKNPLQFINETKTTVNVDYSKAFVWTLDPSELLPLSVIESNRQTVKEIRTNPKFNNYNSGILSPTLYIKNLPHKTDPLTLVSLFGHFEEENKTKIEYRILKGKMKGQAFVKFQNESVSEMAFMLCNGYILDGKPLVIEYGKLPR